MFSDFKKMFSCLQKIFSDFNNIFSCGSIQKTVSKKRGDHWSAGFSAINNCVETLIQAKAQAKGSKV